MNKFVARKRGELLDLILKKGLSTPLIINIGETLQNYADIEDDPAMEKQAERMLKLIESMESEEEIAEAIKTF